MDTPCSGGTGNTIPYEEKQPWNETCRVLADRDRFWAQEFMEPARIVMADRSLLNCEALNMNPDMVNCAHFVFPRE